MPRKTLIRSQEYPYHITARTNNKEHFKSSIADVWKAFELHTYEIVLLFKVKIHALVIMPNHFHMLITTPHEDVGKVMMYFMRSVTRTLNLLSGRSGRVFSSRYHWCLVQNEHYYWHALKYIYQNPVRAKLCEKAELYPYSTLHGLSGHNQLLIPCVPLDKVYQQSFNEFLDWIDHPTPKEHTEAIQKALRRVKFQLPRDPTNKHAHSLENELS